MGKLRAAASEVDLCPTAGVWLCGFSARTEPSIGQHDALCAHAVLLDDGTTRIAIVSCDLIGYSSAQAWELRARIASRSSIPANNILICCTHTHSGPASTVTRGVLGQADEVWQVKAFASIINMVIGLEDRLVPAKIAYAGTDVQGIGYNRDDNTKPIDTELMTVAINTMDDQPIATLLNYATHAVVMGPSSLLFSADYPGSTVRAIQAARGGTGLFLQGACGDVDPLVYRERGWGTGTFDDCDQMGNTLATHALKSIETAVWLDDVVLQNDTTRIELPLDPPVSEHELTELVALWEADCSRAAGDSIVEKKLGNSELFLRWAGDMLDASARKRVPTNFAAEISVMAINDLRLIAVPFEAYSDIATRIKSTLGAGKTAFVGYTNGEHGYLPSRWAKERGGYGADTSCRVFTGLLTAFGLGADEVLVDECVTLAQQLDRK